MESEGLHDWLSDLDHILVGELVSEEKAGGVIESSALLVFDSGDEAPVSVAVGQDPPGLPVDDGLLHLNVVHSEILNINFGDLGGLRADHLDFPGL